MKLKRQRVATVLIVCLVLSGCSGAETQTSPTERTTAGQPIDDQTTTERMTSTRSETEAVRRTETQAGSRIDTEISETTPISSPTETETRTSSEETETETRTSSEETETETGSGDSVESPIDGGTARKAVVTRVIDGDTVEVRFMDGEVDTIRLIGVDTPETSLSNQDTSEYGIPDTPSGSDWLLMWGENAESFANDKLAGEEILVVTDPESERRGYYGRLLAYIYVDGESFGHMLLESGYARVYTGAEFTLEEEYVQTESNAQDANRGLWAYDEEHTTPAPTLAPTPQPSPTETSSDVVTPPLPADGDYDCGHFDTHEQAQEVFNDNAEDVYRLDGDGDGQACESLP